MKFHYQDESNGEILIEYLSFKDQVYAEALKQYLDRGITEEFNVDWENAHFQIKSLADYLD